MLVDLCIASLPVGEMASSSHIALPTRYDYSRLIHVHQRRPKYAEWIFRKIIHLLDCRVISASRTEPVNTKWNERNRKTKLYVCSPERSRKQPLSLTHSLRSNIAQHFHIDSWPDDPSPANRD